MESNKKEKNGFFEDSNGCKSSLRLFSFLLLLTTFFVICFQVYINEINLYLIITLLMFSFAPKVAQKIVEEFFKNKT